MITSQRIERRAKLFLSVLLLLLVVLSVLSLSQTNSALNARGITAGSKPPIFMYGFFSLSLMAAGGMLVLIWYYPSQFQQFEEWFSTWAKRTGWILWFVAVMAYALVQSALCIPFTSEILQPFVMRALLLIEVGFLGMLAFKAWKVEWKWYQAWIASMLGLLMFLKIVGLAVQVSDYPFSLSWSEGSSIYYASLVASKQVYGEKLPLSVIFPARAILDSVPFLVGSFPIWVHRFWSVFLQGGLTLLASLVLVRRLRNAGLFFKWIAAILFFVLFLEVGVKYELMVCVLLIFLGISPHHPWRSLAFLSAASFWAGVTQMNWYPIPMILAAGLYFLEEPVEPFHNWLHYLSRLVSWLMVSIGMVLLGSIFTFEITHNEIGTLINFGFGAAFLWYRLLPNPTNPLGVLIGIILLTFPLLGLSYVFISRKLHFIRWLGLLAITVILLAGGILVSVKIGGGADWHNADSLIVFTAILAGYSLSGSMVADHSVHQKKQFPWIGLVLVILIQAGFTFSTISPIWLYDRDAAERSLEKIQSFIEAASQDGEVLFIGERQLLALGFMPSIPLTYEYELVEMASRGLSDQGFYAGAFESDLCARRFNMIVAQTQQEYLKGSDYSFGEENDLWVIQVSWPLLRTYESVLELPAMNIQLYAPKDEMECP